MSEFWEEAWSGLGAAKGPPRPSYKPSLLPLLSLSPRGWPISDQRQLGAGVWLGAWGDPWGPAWASLAHHLCLCLTVNSPLREGRVRPGQGSEAEAETWTSRSGQGHGAAAAWGPLALPSEEAEAGRDRATEERPREGAWSGGAGRVRDIGSRPVPGQRLGHAARLSPGARREAPTPGGGRRAAGSWVCVGGSEEGRREEAGFLKLPSPQRQTDRQLSRGGLGGHSCSGESRMRGAGGLRPRGWWEPQGGGRAGGRVSEEVALGATVPGGETGADRAEVPAGGGVGAAGGAELRSPFAPLTSVRAALPSWPRPLWP